MSVKQVAFTAAMFPAPKKVYDFIIVNPEMVLASLLVEATTYPAIGLGVVAIPIKGENVYRPTVPEIGGVWRCRIPESELMMAKESLIYGQSKIYSISGLMTNRIKSLTLIPLGPYNLPLPPIILKDCWMKSREGVELNNSDPTVAWKWNVEFYYSAVKEYHWGVQPTYLIENK
jgi:hypothetical protein